MDKYYMPTEYMILHHEGVNPNMLRISILYSLFMITSCITITGIYFRNLMKKQTRKQYEIYTKSDMANIPNELGKRMKFYETHTENNVSVIPNAYPFIIKLDGRNFSKIFKNTTGSKTNLPFYEYKHAMELTVVDLIKEFHATTGYTYSDKMILIFPPSTHMFNGRIMKLQSIIASFATSRFISHLTNLFNGVHVVDNNTSYENCKFSYQDRQPRLSNN